MKKQSQWIAVMAIAAAILLFASGCSKQPNLPPALTRLTVINDAWNAYQESQRQVEAKEAELYDLTQERAQRELEVRGYLFSECQKRNDDLRKIRMESVDCHAEVDASMQTQKSLLGIPF